MKIGIKRKIIIWTMIIWIIIFIGLYEDSSYSLAGSQHLNLELYGFQIGYFHYELAKFSDDGKMLREADIEERGLYKLKFLVSYKYQIALAILLIGLALFVTIKEE